MKGYPSWFGYRLISATLIALLLSGLSLQPTALEMRFQWEEVPLRLPGSWRVGAAAAHAALAFVGCLMLGALFSLHIRQGWRKRRHLVSGIAQLSFWAVLLGTALALYYAPWENFVRWSSGAHSVLGILLVATFFWHARPARPAIGPSSRGRETL